MWLIIGLGLGIIGWCLWDIYKYYKAFSNWANAKGIVIGYHRSSWDTYVKVRFHTIDRKEIVFEESSPVRRDVFAISTGLLFPEGSSINVLYSTTNPRDAMIKTIFTPLRNLIGIMIGLAFCYCAFVK